MGLFPKTLEGITSMGFTNPTEVQEKVIPYIIAGKEVVARSKTGSGKTCAFGIGIYELLAAGKAKKALILAPVRELAIQIMNELRALGKFHHYRVAYIYGGQNIDTQIKLLYNGVDILVATPGRLLDLFERGVIDLNEYDVVVLDEADKMFEMGFVEDVDKILSNTSYARKVQLFSATINDDVLRIASKYMKEYEIVEVGELEKPPEISEERIKIERPQKFNKLVDIIKEQKQADPTGKIIIFVATQRAAEYVGRKLREVGIDSSFIHGDVAQNRREKIMHNFKKGISDILVATDVAARGLHVDNVSLVVNYDEAMDHHTHIHRIGRTGRMGATGKAITFVEENPFFGRPLRSGFRPKIGPYNPYAGCSGGDGGRFRGRGSRRPHSGGRRPYQGGGSHGGRQGGGSRSSYGSHGGAYKEYSNRPYGGGYSHWGWDHDDGSSQEGAGGHGGGYGGGPRSSHMNMSRKHRFVRR